MARILIRSAPNLIFSRTFNGDALHSVGDSVASGVKFGGQEILVAVASRDAEAGTGGQHARAGNVSGVDRVAEGDIRIAGSAYIANRGEAGL